MRRYLVLALVLLLAACSVPVQREETESPRIQATPATIQENAEETTSNPLPPVEPGETAVPPLPEATSTPAPVVGGHVTEIIPLYPKTLNPLFTENESQGRVLSLMFEGLMEIDPETREPVPALAENVEVSADGLRYTFKLKPNVMWHNGARLTTRDVVWTYDLLGMPELEAPLQPYAKLIKGVTSPDPSTVVFTLTKPYAPFLARLGTAPLLPRKPFVGLSGPRLKAALLNWKSPEGVGPFRWAGASQGQSIELEAHQQYHGEEPLLDRYSFRVIRDAAAIQQALAAGEADLAWLPPSLTGELSQQDFLSQNAIPTPTSTLLIFNLDSAEGGARVSDKRVRRALAIALNLEKISASMKGTITPAVGFYPRTSPAYLEQEEAPYAYNPQEAKALLTQAGWRDTDGDGIRQKGGRQLTLTLLANQVPKTFPVTLGMAYTPALQRIATDWKAVGARVRVRQEGWEQLAPRLFSTHSFETALVSISGDADPDLGYLWSTEAYSQGFNAGRYSSKAVDGLLDEGLRLRTSEERTEIYDMLQRQLVSDVPAVPIGTTEVVIVSNNRLIGTPTNYWSALQHTNIEKWYVQDGQ